MSRQFGESVLRQLDPKHTLGLRYGLRHTLQESKAPWLTINFNDLDQVGTIPCPGVVEMAQGRITMDGGTKCEHGAHLSMKVKPRQSCTQDGVPRRTI